MEKFRDFLDSDTPGAKATYVALCALALASLPVLVFAAAAMGNAVQVFKRFDAGSKFDKKQAITAINHLKRERFIEYVADKDGKTIMRITKKGEIKLRAFAINLIEIKKPNRWDGKWRLVIFDIPIRFRKAREALRWKIKDLGFVQLQKSVWIYPYPCEDEILFIADFFGVGKYVEILTADSFLRENKFKKHFNLA